MPKVRYETAEERRLKAFVRAIDRGLKDEGFKFYYEVAEEIGVSPVAFSKWRSGDRNISFVNFCNLARTLKFTPQEVCTIAGIPYE